MSPDNLKPNAAGILVDPSFPHEIKRAYDLLYFDGVLGAGQSYVEFGAHTGHFLKKSELWKIDAEFHLFEPQGAIANELQDWLYSTKRQRFFTVYRLAVCPQTEITGTTQLVQGGDTSQGACLQEYDDKATAIQEVMVYSPGDALRLAVPLDDKPIRFLAINAEQAEYGILKNPVIAERCEFVTVEFHPGKSGINTRDFIAEHLADKFRLIGFARAGEPYEIGLLQNRRIER